MARRAVSASSSAALGALLLSSPSAAQTDVHGTWSHEISKLLHTQRCDDIFIDVGTNQGVQIRKLFEPHRYSGAPLLPIFEEFFGAAPRCRVCALGFEPNPAHSPVLDELEQRLGAAGARVKVLRAGVSYEHGWLNFTHHTSDAPLGVTFSAAGADSELAPLRVPVVSLVEVLRLVGRLRLAMWAHHTRTARQQQQTAGVKVRRPRVLLKLDIEGLEGLLLDHVLRDANATLCSVVDGALIEFHHTNSFLKLSRAQRVAIKSTKQRLMDLVRRGSGCPTRVVDIDDETYAYGTNMPWPEPAPPHAGGGDSVMCTLR